MIRCYIWNIYSEYIWYLIFFTYSLHEICRGKFPSILRILIICIDYEFVTFVFFCVFVRSSIQEWLQNVREGRLIIIRIKKLILLRMIMMKFCKYRIQSILEDLIQNSKIANNWMMIMIILMILIILHLSQYSYKKVFSLYVEDQIKLEKDHIYVWVDGEKKYNNNLENLCFLSDSQKRTISNYSHVELFEQFFSDDMKNYIVQVTNENGYALTLGDLNIFIGILILSTFNKRKSQKDYWFLSCFMISFDLLYAVIFSLR